MSYWAATVPDTYQTAKSRVRRRPFHFHTGNQGVKDMFSRKSTRRSYRKNPRVSGMEGLEARKMMAGDGLPGFGLPDLPQLLMPNAPLIRT